MIDKVKMLFLKILSLFSDKQFAIADVWEKVEEFIDGRWVLVERKHLGKNTIKVDMKRAAARGLATGSFGISGNAPVVHTAFKYGASDYLFGKKPSNDTNGVDLIDGGDGTESYAEFSSYIIAASNIEVTQVDLVYAEQDLGVGQFDSYAYRPVQRQLTTDQKYTIEYKITFP
jgi:hypothetical protein